MDRERIVRTMLVMAIAMVLVLSWNPAVEWFARRQGWQVRPSPAQTSTTQPTTEPSITVPSTVGAIPATSPTLEAPTAAAVAGSLRVVPSTQPLGSGSATIGSITPNDPQYQLAVRLAPQAASIHEVVLNDFKREARKPDPYVYQHSYAGHEQASRPLATQNISINGTSIDLSSAVWTLDRADQSAATYSLTIATGELPFVRLTKTYQLFDSADANKGYEVSVRHNVQNLTNQEMKVRIGFNGPTMPPREQLRGGERQVLAGFDYKNTVLFAYDAIEYFGEKHPSKDYIKDADGNLMMWLGSSSIYFNAIIRPLPLDGGAPAPGYIEKATATVVGHDPNMPEENKIVLTFNTTELTVAPGQSRDIPLRAFFGPRQRDLLKSTYYATFPIEFAKTLVLTSGLCAACTFQWLIDLLVWLLAAFHWLFGGFMGRGDWGLAIIALVVLVRALLHPITKRSQIAMSKMSKMAPEMERLKKKHGDDKDALSKAMWELQKEQGVGAYLGCLPMFLQMPIWIALWQALQTTFELRHAPFLWGYTWIDDLSMPDLLLHWDPVGIPLIFTTWYVSGLNILPILMGVVFFIQMKVQPKPPTMSKEQEQQQKMMQWMTLLFPLFLYNGPSGLNLYIMTSTIIGIIESKIVRDHIKQRDEAEKAGRVIVDAGKKFKGGGGGGGTTRVSVQRSPDKPRGGIMGWFADLQERADQVRREADKRGK